jgi:Zn-dependent oligopeptidase
MRFEEMKEIHVWHEEVKQFSVYNSDDNAFLGFL